MFAVLFVCGILYGQAQGKSLNIYISLLQSSREERITDEIYLISQFFRLEG